MRVPRSEGEVALRTSQQMTTAIANSSAQTKAAIGESAAVTREELQRLQFTQEISNLELRLATIQSEIRTLNRMPATKVTKQQLRQLRGQEIGIQHSTNGSQFFITFGPADWLNGQHTIFGEVIDGLEVLDKLKRVEPPLGPLGDMLYTVTIEESDTSKLPTPTPLPPTPTPFAPNDNLESDRLFASMPLEQRTGYFNTAPENTLDTSKSYTAIIATSKGNLVVTLNDDAAPVAVNNFVTLANLGFYDGSPVNDVAPGELVVLGSPTGDPSADVGYKFKPEVNLPITPKVGSLAYGCQHVVQLLWQGGFGTGDFA